ncbi:HvfC/BufC N-terminal domain-containing protein [Pseudomaricurvus sp.]|uniref:HvfC/BufC N-terminal domain-containing protein n=1 Tax=Pseudomaricurvus sp. TaxID=2004510 RepID=UPI003F6CA777
MNLYEWQSEFQGMVMDSSDLQDRPSVIKANKLDLLQQGDIQDQRLGIYQHAYQQRLSEALKSNFPAVHQLLGDVDFSAAARGFLRQCPPSTASIRWYGEKFPTWLETQTPYNSCPAISELARFEWVMRHAIDAKDAKRITVDELQILSPEQWTDLKFQRHPSVSILSLRWNAIQVWQALENDEIPPEPIETPSHWLVYRQDNLMNAWRSSDLLEIDSLRLITNGQSFGDLCETLLDHYQDSQVAIGQAAIWLKTWTEEGLLVPRDSV